MIVGLGGLLYLFYVNILIEVREREEDIVFVCR